jgi:hypothetical protein
MTYADLTQPIIIAVDAQDIGRLYANKANPRKYNQFLMELFRQAGAPVEGILDLKFKHGAMARFIKEAKPGVFHYAWLPENWVVNLKTAQKQAGGQAW